MDIASNAPLIGLIVGIFGVVMPVWLRSLDYLIHRWRRFRQVANIRKIVEDSVKLFLDSDTQNLPMKSATPGAVGQVLKITEERIDVARCLYIHSMKRNLDLAIEDFSNDLDYEKKRDKRSYLAFQDEFFESWRANRNDLPSMEVYQQVLIRKLRSIAWLKLGTEGVEP